MPLFRLKNFLPSWNLRDQQTSNIIFITFWSQFSTYALFSVLILFLTRPLLSHGLGYSEEKAYAFMGVSQALGYLMPIIGGFIADMVLGVRRAILLGSLVLASTYLLVVLSGYTLQTSGDTFFLAAYALIPASGALLMGTASSMVSHIYSEDVIKAKAAMTFYYMAINGGALLAIFLAPNLLNSRFGPLSVLFLSFIGKLLAALNFARRYKIYDPVIWGKDTKPFLLKDFFLLLFYFITIYLLTLLAYFYVRQAMTVITIGCIAGILWFLWHTLQLKGVSKQKQLMALILILEAVVFFIIYNQMNSTLVLFAKNNSNLQLFGLSILPAQYQILNPILIILLGTQLPKFYQRFPHFTIPYQFAAGTALAGAALLLLAFASSMSTTGYINGNYLGFTYILITLGELWVSAIGLSMIGLYCDMQKIAFAMGVWYLASSLSNTVSGRLAASFVALPTAPQSPWDTLPLYQHYYFILGLITLSLAVLMCFIAYLMGNYFRKKGLSLG